MRVPVPLRLTRYHYVLPVLGTIAWYPVPLFVFLVPLCFIGCHYVLPGTWYQYVSPGCLFPVHTLPIRYR